MFSCILYPTLGQATKISTLFGTNYLPGNSSSSYNWSIKKKWYSNLNESPLISGALYMYEDSVGTLFAPALFLLSIVYAKKVLSNPDQD